MGKEDKEIKISTLIYSIIIFFLAGLALEGLFIYGFNLDNALTRLPVKYLPYPAAIVGKEIITIEELKNRVAASKKFYESQDFSEMGLRVDFSTPEGQKRLKVKEKYLLGKLIEDAVVEQEANKLGVKLTEEAISQEVDRYLGDYGDKEEVKNKLSKLYGWTLADFEENIVKPDMYREKLAEKIKENEASYWQSKDKISKAAEDLKKGRDFESIVTQYSEGDSAQNKGDLGWFSAEEMLPELAQTAFRLKTGEKSDVIESSLGFHIIKLDDRKNEDGIDKVKIKQIFVRTISLGDWLGEKEKDSSIYVPLKNYIWDKQNLMVEFNQEDLKNFEENIYQNSPDDISVIF